MVNKSIETLKNMVEQKEKQLENQKEQVVNDRNNLIKSSKMEFELEKESRNGKFKISWGSCSYNNYEKFDKLIIEYNGKNYEISLKQPDNIFLERENLWIVDNETWFEFDGKNKEEDMKNLKCYYEVRDTFENLIESDCLSELVDLIFENHNDIKKTEEEIRTLNKQIDEVIKQEINCEIKRLLEHGGEVIVEPNQSYTTIMLRNENYSNSSFKKFISPSLDRKYFMINGKDNDGYRHSEYGSKFVIGKKIKGKQSYEVEVYENETLNESINDSINNTISFKNINKWEKCGDIILTKQTLTEHIKSIFWWNYDGINDRTEDVKTYIKEVIDINGYIFCESKDDMKCKIIDWLKLNN